MNRRLWHLIVGTRGGLKRAEILHLVGRRPYNAHEISRLLGASYKTARHHLNVLVENDLLQVSDDRYGTLYFWSRSLKDDVATWELIWSSLGDQPSLKRYFHGEASL